MSSHGDRKSGFKNIGRTAEHSRRNREGATVEIRKQKREESFSKRRALFESPSADSLDLDKRTVEQLVELLPQVKNDLYSPDSEKCLVATKVFRQTLSRDKNPPIAAVLEQKVLPRMVELLETDSTTVPQETREIFEKIQLEAAWTLTNIAAGTSENTAEVLDAGALPLFARLLQSPNEDLADQAVWAFGNIAGDGPVTRDMLHSSKISDQLIALLQKVLAQKRYNIGHLRSIVWALSNLVRGKPAPNVSEIHKLAPVFAFLLENEDTEVLSDTCWGLSYITDGLSEAIDCVIENNGIPPLVRCLASPAVAVQSPALRAIGNIATGSDQQTQAVIEAGVLYELGPLLLHSKQSVVREACWMVSNITAGTPAQIKAVFNSGVVPSIVEHILTSEFKIRKEACWALSNATSPRNEHPEIIEFLVENGAIEAFCKVLDCKDQKIIVVALSGLENILESGEDIAAHTGSPSPYCVLVEEAGGLDMLTELQESQSIQVYNKAKGILETYFQGEEDSLHTNNQESSISFDFDSQAHKNDYPFEFD
ncbi:MAG: Importin alpha subunit [Amphiamblys sp. WSBS2006]|nr:MAG: Importin alpha subunit [Amphiamblys sp. WSBS2006]